MKLLISAEDATIDMTDLTNNVKLNTAMETVGASLTFDIARNYNDVDFASCENIKIGDVVILEVEGKTIFKA